MSGKCGHCTLCCKVLAVDILNKPAGKVCTHVITSKVKGTSGCGIYKDRPPPCISFRCFWLDSQEGEKPMPTKLRPDRCGVVLWVTPDTKMVVAVCDQDIPGAWQGLFINPILNAVSHETKVVVADGDTYWAVEKGVAHKFNPDDPAFKDLTPTSGK